MSIFRFTPDFMGGEQIDAIAVGRERLLEYFARKIRNAMRDGCTINMIFVGPRGIGKSHTALRLMAKLEAGSGMTPVRLSEEEYSVSSLDEFFSRVLDVLGEEYDRGEIVERARDILKGYQDRGRPAVIMVENLQMLFSEMSEELPVLRSIILEDHSFCIIGTALHTFEQITSPSAAFYNFFEISRLKGLDADETLELVNKRIESVVKNDPLPDPGMLDLGGLHILTGGNPRLVHTICDIIIRKRCIGSLEDDFMEMLDGLTPFYQAVMDVMSAEKRRVFDTLALSGGPATPTEIARRLNDKNTTVTAHLARLKSEGFVERVKLRQKKETRYQVSDKLCRMWREFRTRDGRAKIAAFVRFLEIWYSHDGRAGGYHKASYVSEPAPPRNTGGARSGSRVATCMLDAAPDGSPPLDYVVGRFVGIGDYDGARREIREFRDRAGGEPNRLLSMCNEIIAKKAEMQMMAPGVKYENRIADIFDRMREADQMIADSADDMHDDGRIHAAVSGLIECAIMLGELNLADSINCHIRAGGAAELKKCGCFTRQQITIMIMRKDYATALKTIDAALNNGQNPSLIAYRIKIHTQMGDRDQAIRDARILLETDEFLGDVLSTYANFLMFADLLAILREKIPNVESMKGRNGVISRLLADITEALQRREPDINSDALVECIRMLSPFITPEIISAGPLHVLVEHGRGAERIERTLAVLFRALTEDQRGILQILKCTVDYILTLNTDCLERLHPEQRELSFDMIAKISPTTNISEEILNSI